MEGGEQIVSMEDDCMSRHGVILHEFMHAFAMHHEHSRGDRDDYVIINWDNIAPGRSFEILYLSFLIPANTKHLNSICTAMEQRRRRLADVVQK